MQHRRCTLQVTIGILLVLAAACGEGKAVPTSGPAGHVIAVQGEVSATRPGQAARALEVDDAVFGDDTLITGKASSIQVELTHNGARWQLGSDAERRVDTSLAWRATRQEQALLATHEEIKTGSAGRNTTREAAESRETLLEQETELEEAADLEQPVTAEPKRKSRSRTARKSSSTPKDEASSNETSGSRQEIQPLLPLQAEPMAPAPPSKKAKGAESAENAPAPDSAPAPPQGGSSKPDAGAATLRSHVLEVTRRCHAEHSGRGTLKVAITVTGGKASQLRVTGPDALEPVRRCVDAALRGVALPGGGSLSEAIPLRQ